MENSAGLYTEVLAAVAVPVSERLAFAFRYVIHTAAMWAYRLAVPSRAFKPLHAHFFGREPTEQLRDADGSPLSFLAHEM